MKKVLHRLRAALPKPGALILLMSLMFHFPLCAQQGGNVLKLNGNGYVEVPGMARDDGGPITIEFWSYVSTGDVQDGAVFTIGGDNANNVQAHAPWSDGYLYWDYGTAANGGRIRVDYVPYLNKWTHVALVSEGNDGFYKAIYLDGQVVAEDYYNPSDGPDERVAGFTIGKNGSLYHRGMIDELRIWNVARTRDEIFLNISSAASGFESGIEAVYHFDETAGATTTADASFNAHNGTLVGNAAIVAPDAVDLAPYVLSCTRHNPSALQTTAASVTFRVTFSEDVTGVAAQDFTAVVTGQLNTGTMTVNAISATVYDVTVPVDGKGSVQLDIADNATIEDAGGNACEEAIIDGEEYWIAHARFLAIGPESGSTVGNTKISYNPTLTLTSGTVTWTRTGGAADPGSPHVQAFTGNERFDGLHENITLANNPTLVSGAVYTITFNGIANDGQVVPEVSVTDILFDRHLTFVDADPAFDPGNGAYDVRAIGVQQDGRIVIGGGFNTYNYETRNHVARLNSDGTLDVSFNPGEGADGSVNAMLLQPDNKALIAGEFTMYQGANRSHIARLNADGSLDETFEPEARNWNILTMLPQGDKVLIGGQFDIGSMQPSLARLNADGSTDESFNVDPGLGGTVTCMFAQGDGKIMVGGRFIVRLNADGTISEDFGFHYPDMGFEGMSGFSDDLVSVTAMAPQPDGKIVVAALVSYQDGGFEEFATRIFRLNADGTLDETFNTTIVELDDWEDQPVVRSMLLQSDGKLIITGYFERFSGERRNHIARLNADGSLDPSFSPGGTDDEIRAMSAQNDGNILVGGRFSEYNDYPRPGIARIDPVSPLVLSSVRQSPVTGTTLATSVTFRVTFSEAVTDVGARDFTTAITGNVTTGNLSVAAVSSAIYDVTVPSITGTGTLRLDVAGNAAITDLAGNNYNATFTTGESYTIGKASQVITIDPIADRTVGDGSFVVTVTSSSGLPVTITTTSDKVTMVNNQVTIISAGRVSITANQPGNDSYHAAPPAEGSFCIRPATPVITVSFEDPEHPVLTSNAPAGNQWYFNNEAIETATQPTLQATAHGVYKVRVTADDCASEFSADRSIQPRASQTITFDAIPDQTVGDSPFTITATASSGLPVTITTASDKITVVDNQVTLVSAGRVTVTANQPGNDEYLAASPVEKSFCISPAQPVITASFDDPAHPVLTSSAASGNEWYRNNELITTATEPTLQVTAPGVYTVQAKADDCVSERSAGVTVLITDLEEELLHEKITVSPNPANDLLMVSVPAPVEKLQVISATGRVYEVRVENIEGRVRVDIAGLTPGVYVLQVVDRGVVRARRFVKK